MITYLFITGFLWVLLSFFTVRRIAKQINKEWLSLIHWGSLIFGFGFTIILGFNLGFMEGQSKALKGKFEYKMNITYELKDSNYVPVDTILIKIK